MTDTRFAPGSATAHVTDDVIAMIGADGAEVDVTALCATTTDWPTLVTAFSDRAEMAVVRHDAEVLRIGVVGALTVSVQTADGEQRFDGATTWATYDVDRARHVTICSGSVARPSAQEPVEPDLRYRVDAGMVPASIVSRALVAPSVEAIDPFEALFGHTIVRSVEAAAVRTDEATAAHAQAPLGVLVFSTGERVVVDRSMVLGRNPRELDDDSTPSIRRVKVASPGVSRQHAMIRIDRWHASIDDLGSSNGTRILLPGRPAKPVQPGHPVDLVPGAVIDLGGDVSFAVEEVA